MTEYTLKPLNKRERLYSYKQPHQIACNTGYYGYYHCDFGKDGKQLNAVWQQFGNSVIKENAENDRENVMNYLADTVLNSFKSMQNYCYENSEAAFDGNFSKEYGFRLDTKDYSYIIRFCPNNKGDYTAYIFDYNKQYLDNHLSWTQRDILFVSSDYRALFRLEDGDKILIRNKNGEEIIRTCRFIDTHHTYVGDNLYHICQFAEISERNGDTVIPYRNSLPDKCYVYIDTREAFGIVTKGKDGFELCAEAKFPDRKRNFEYADKLNEELGITKAQSEAMTMASMMGWADKLADPRTYEPKQKTDYDRGGR